MVRFILLRFIENILYKFYSVALELQCTTQSDFISDFNFLFLKGSHAVRKIFNNIKLNTFLYKYKYTTNDNYYFFLVNSL